MYEVYEVDPGNFVPVFENILELIHPDDIKHVRRNIEQGIETGILYPVNYRIIANGKTKEIAGSGSFGTNEQGERIMIGLVQDITEKKKNEILIIEANKELAEKNTALEKTNRELEQFARIASHDLQEPLRKIQTFSNMLKGKVGNKEAIESYLERISVSAERMQTLVRDVLNYSRTSHLEEKFEAVDLNNIILYKTTKGQAFENKTSDILFHIINHSTYHRGQIAADFRQTGTEPLSTDYIFYKR